MSEYFKKENSTISVMESFRKIQKQIDPLYEFRNSLSALEVSNRDERTNAALSIAEIAKKAFEQQNLVSDNITALSASANLAQPQIQEAIASQDSFRKIAEGLKLNSNAKFVAESTIKGIYKNDLYKDTVTSIDRLRESLEPWRDSISIAGKAFYESEFANLVRELQTSTVIPESTFSEFAGIVEQLESLSSLDSFKALSRIKNLPTDTELNKASNTNFERLQATLAEVKRLDAKISTEVSNTDDFNELSEETQRDSSLFLKNYRWLMMNLVVSLCLIEDYLDEDLDLSRKSFTIADNVEGSIFFIGNYWNQNKAAIINGLITTAIYNAFIWLVFIK